MPFRIFALTVALLSPVPLLANQLPTGGVCEKNEVFTADITLTTRAEWNGDRASVTDHHKTFPAQVKSVREHSDAFKLNLAYEDSILGDSELIIFRIPSSNPPEYRMGIVTFENDEGQRVADTMSPFYPVECAVFY